MGQWRHVHVGCGKLGLGLIGDVISSLPQCSGSILLNREYPAEATPKPRLGGGGRDRIFQLLNKNKKYLVSWANEGDKPERKEVEFNSIHFFPRSSDIPDFCERCEQSLSAVANPETRLVTTAVGEGGLYDVGFLLAEGLQRRMETSSESCPPLYVLACENMERSSEALHDYIIERSSGRDLSRFVERAVVFCNTVVDRICSQIRISENDNLVEVVTEQGYDWIVERDGTGRAKELEDFFGASLVRFVNDIDPFEKRKFWLVNGVHLALAAMAANKMSVKKDHTHLKELRNALDNKEIGPKLELYQADIAQALYEATTEKTQEGPKPVFSPEELMIFNEKVRARIRASDDDIDRVVRDLLELTRIENLIFTAAQTIYREMRQGRINLSETPRTETVLAFMIVIEKHLKEMVQGIGLSTFFHKVDARLSQPVKELLTIMYEQERKEDRTGHQAISILLEMLKFIGNVYDQHAEILKHANIVGNYFDGILLGKEATNGT